MPPPIAPRKDRVIQVVKALNNYHATNEDELSFKVDDVLYVLGKEEDGWWTCRLGDKKGKVPLNYGVGDNFSTLENPLHEASKRGNIELVRELLENGVSVNSYDKAGNTCIHWACRGGHSDVLKELLLKKPELNCQNKLGDTALHCAAWGGHAQIIRLLLLESTIQNQLRNRDGMTALQLAKNDTCAALLLEYLQSTNGNADEDDSDDE